MPDQLRYVAFISYSQRDKKAAQRVQRLIEAYRVPGVSSRKQPKLGRVFRDDDEMAAAADLGAALRGAIEDTENLVVICSPNSARSKWVNAEIEHFRKTGRGDRVFAIIIRGKPNSGDPETECLPPLLRTQAIAEEGALEPLALDWRRESKRRLLTRLAAGFLKIPFDSLWQRERRRAGQRRLVATLAGLVVSAGTLFAASTVRMRQLAAQDQADIPSYILAAQQALDSNRPARAARIALLATEALPWRKSAPDSAVHLLNLASQKLFGSPDFLAHNKEVNAIAFSPDGTQMATASDDGTVVVWRLSDGTIIAVLRKFLSEPDAAIYSEDGRYLFVSDGLALSVWDTSNWSRLSEHRGSVEKLPRSLEGIQKSGDDYFLAGSSSGGRPALWRLSGDSLEMVNELPLEADRFVYSACSAHAQYCASVSEQGDYVDVFDMTASEPGPLARIDQFEGTLLMAPAFSADGKFLALKSSSSPEIWELGDAPRAIARADFIGGRKFTLSPDGQKLLFVDRDDAFHGVDDTVYLWNIHESSTPLRITRLNDREITKVAFSPDGDHVIVASLAGEVLSVPFASQASDSSLQIVGEEGTTAAALSPDGTQLASVLSDGTLRIHDLANPKNFQETSGPQEAEEIVWSPDGKWLSVYGSSKPDLADDFDRLVHVYASADFKAVAVIDPFADMAETIFVHTQAFSPDGKWLAIGGNGAVFLWPLSDWSTPVVLMETDEDGIQEDFEIDKVRFSADSQYLVSANDWGSTVRIWDLKSGTSQRVENAADLDSGVVEIDLIPVTGQFVLRTQNGQMVLVDPKAPQSATVVRDLFLPGDTTASISADGSIAAFQDQERIVVWNVANDEQMRAIDLGEYSILLSSALSPDGKLLAVADMQTGLHVYDAQSGIKLLDSAVRLTTTDIQFFPDGSGLLIDQYQEPPMIWKLPGLQAPAMQTVQLRSTLCKDGRLLPEQRILTLEDTASAPFLNRFISRDVCKADSDMWRHFIGLE